MAKKQAENTIKKDNSIEKAQEREQQNKQPPVEIPAVKTLTKDEIIEMYREDIKKKDEMISSLRRENQLLLDLTMKNAKRRLEELEIQVDKNEEKKIKKK